MEIAPGISDSDWKTLDLNLSADRCRAVDIFQLRIEERFLKPTRAMMALPWSGFAVLALDSLLIETLEQFTQGVEVTPRKQAETYFRASLRRPAFGNAFDDTRADLFRLTIRNGILHQAEVKGSSLVHRIGPLVQLTPAGDGIIVNRVLFHACVEQAVTHYAADVKASGSSLWPPFRAKMEFIAGKNLSSP